LDDKTGHIHVTLGKEKYKNEAYDDKTVEYLMKYLEIESYEQLEDFLKNCHVPTYN
jgi:hypothetical protein